MDFNLAIGDVKPAPTGLVTLIPKLQPCYQHSHKIDRKNAEKRLVLKEEERRTSTTEIKLETTGATGNASNDVRIQLKFCGDDDLLVSCSDNEPVEQEIHSAKIENTVHVDSCVPMNMTRTDAKICRGDSTSGNYKCDVCRKPFTRTSSVTRHTKTHGRERNHKCETCNKHFTFKAHLSKRVESHAADDKYKCAICGRRFKIRRNMQRHIEVNHNGESYKCEICAKSFATRRYMLEHAKLHTDEKWHECRICGKSIKTKRDVSEHVKIHAGDKNFKCDVCNKRFKRKPSLSEHAKVHGKRREFECDVCRKCFTTRRILSKDAKVHTDDRKHPCEIGEKRCKTRRSAVEHVKIHSDVMRCNVQSVGEFGNQSIEEETDTIKEEKFEIDNDTIERKLSMALNESDTDTVVIDEKPKSTDIFELWQSLNDAIVIKEEENFDE